MLEVTEQKQIVINVPPVVVVPTTDPTRQLAEEARVSNTLEAMALRASQIGRRLGNRSKDISGADDRPTTHITIKPQPTAKDLGAQQQKNLAEMSRSKNMWD